MMYMSPSSGPSLVAGHPQQQQVHQATPSASYQEWLKAWKSWAGTRKRGKMAQFIVQKLEENVSKKENLCSSDYVVGGGGICCVCKYLFHT